MSLPDKINTNLNEISDLFGTIADNQPDYPFITYAGSRFQCILDMKIKRIQGRYDRGYTSLGEIRCRVITFFFGYNHHTTQCRGAQSKRKSRNSTSNNQKVTLHNLTVVECFT